MNNTTERTIQEFTQKEYIILTLVSILAIEPDKVVEVMQNIDKRYCSGKINKHDMSLPVWSAYRVYSDYKHLLDD